ncbi:hypothetical protein GCM10011579_001270 [Streptomyces albiflavescens]|uniref:Uncharacterized protein n=1 Tax=Streptomyces albiflavescens TaxID=1623582 RepID=A0A918CY06_9ACTN|nr:hypothetical protein GCM10011579_001270 [Streptomyces albiflavescens]
MQSNQVGAGAFRHAQGGFTLSRSGPGGVQDDGLTAGQQGGCAVEQDRVSLVGPLRRVEAFAVAGGRGRLGRDARQLLAEAVTAEQCHSQAVGQCAGERGLPAAREPAHERQADSGCTKVPQGRCDQSACRCLRADRGLA